MSKNIKWIIEITCIAFIITIVFSLGSQYVLKDVGLFFGVLIILLFIIIGIIFDIIGVAVQSSDTMPFHAMASKKIKHALPAKKILKNADKVSSFCNDVIGDICNIISGSAGLVVADAMALKYQLNSFMVTIVITSLIAALTIGGKAFGKKIALNNSEKIINKVSKILKK